MQEEYNLGISNFASNRRHRAAFVALRSRIERATLALKSSCPYASGFDYKVLLANKQRIKFRRVLVVLETTGSETVPVLIRVVDNYTYNQNPLLYPCG
jgi:hypothetical protein